MEAYIFSPCRIALFVFTCHPGAACRVQKVLCAQNVCLEEQLGIFDAAVNMAFCGKVDNVIKFVVGKQLVGQVAVADVSFYKETTFVINIFGDSAQIAGIGQGIQNHYLNVFVFGQNILYIISADKAGSSGN